MTNYCLSPPGTKFPLELHHLLTSASDYSLSLVSGLKMIV